MIRTSSGTTLSGTTPAGFINRVLTDCGGNVSETARRLGLHRRSLQRKLQKRAPEEISDGLE